jgi:hypothetical protein
MHNSARKYRSASHGDGQSSIVAPNGRPVATCHSRRTTRRVLAALNGGQLSDHDQFGMREQRAPTGKVMAGHPILSANGRVIVSCTSRYAQLCLQSSLNERIRLAA